MNKRAFSLIELSLVLVIVGLLVSGSFKIFKPTYLYFKNKSLEDDLQASKININGYFSRTGYLPTDDYFQKNLKVGHSKIYYFPSNLVTDNIFDVNSTNLKLDVTNNDNSFRIINDVAFVLVSPGVDNILQTSKLSDTVYIEKPYSLIHNFHYDDVYYWTSFYNLVYLKKGSK